MSLGTIKIKNIEVGTRRRLEYGDVESLAESIKNEGLIQPIAVAERAKGSEKPYILIAGGRRLQALTLLKWDSCPCNIYPELKNTAELRSMELAENYHREDLTWQEEISLKQEIHEAQVAIHGEKISKAPDAVGWSNKDTADILNVSKQTVQKDIQLSKAIKETPDLFSGCKNKSDANRILKRVNESMITAELAKRAQKTVGSSPKSALISSYQLLDCFEGMSKIPTESVDFFEIDPPYGIDLTEIKKNESDNLTGYTEIDKGRLYIDFIAKVLNDAYLCMKQNSWLILWFAPEPYAEEIYNLITDAGFTTSRMHPVWPKPPGQCLNPASSMANSYECFYVCKKGTPVMNKQGRSNVFDFPVVPAQKKIHPTERPLSMMREILTTFCQPNASIVVPFAGSGVTLVAAHQLDMKAVGFDTTKEYFNQFILRAEKGESE